MVDDIPSPSGISMVGAASVVVFYWIHMALTDAMTFSAQGVEITLFVSAFLAQYIPLIVLKEEM